jgi:hypothetical protein
VSRNQKHRIEQLFTALSRERAQTMPEYTLTLSVISGSSLLAFTRLSESAAQAITSVGRFFI